MTIYSLDILLFQFWTSLLSMCSSNCCFLTCIQSSQEAGQVISYSYLFFAVQETAMQETAVSIPGSGRSPGERNDYPFQYSCLENPMDRGSWQATVYGITKCWTWLEQRTVSHSHAGFNSLAEIESYPMQWKHGVLTTGQKGSLQKMQNQTAQNVFEGEIVNFRIRFKVSWY